MSSTADAKSKAKNSKLNTYPWYSPRIWHGMRTRAWLKLLVKNRFRIHPFRWPLAIAVTFFTGLNSFLYRVQQWQYGRQIAETELTEPPIFIVGHWRS
ncbi:MAG: sulfotransferase, partial [bacterium]|nr:sulfotransferase [bacterium]